MKSLSPQITALINKLGLSPLPNEGGYYVETYRSDEKIPGSALPSRYNGDRSFSTAIYFLITPDDFSTLHRIISDEIFHFYAGDPVEMLLLFPDGNSRIVIMGNDFNAGHIPQVVVPRGVWQGCKLIDGGEYALLGTTVSPGFDFDDYEQGDTEDLASRYPDCRDMIESLS